MEREHGSPEASQEDLTEIIEQAQSMFDGPYEQQFEAVDAAEGGLVRDVQYTLGPDQIGAFPELAARYRGVDVLYGFGTQEQDAGASNLKVRFVYTGPTGVSHTVELEDTMESITEPVKSGVYIEETGPSAQAVQEVADTMGIAETAVAMHGVGRLRGDGMPETEVPKANEDDVRTMKAVLDALQETYPDELTGYEEPDTW